MNIIILDLDKNCSDNDIKAAFRTKALVWHPDSTKYFLLENHSKNLCRKAFKHCFANEKAYIQTISSVFSLIDEAYKTLSNPQKRKQYDLTLAL